MTGAIIQARNGSTRLPGKSMLPLGGVPMLAFILRRLRRALPELPLVVATTTLARDDALAALCEQEQVPWFRGSENDVLARYHACALEFGYRHIVRLTADNPFTDIIELSRLMDAHARTGGDYTHSFAHLPVGTGAEVFTWACLERVHREGRAAHHREHVNEYVLENPRLFQIEELDVPPAKRRPELRLTVDTRDDYERACRIVAEAGCMWVPTEEAVAWLLRSA